MTTVSRRQAIGYAAAASLVIPEGSRAQAENEDRDAGAESDRWTTERRRVMELGFTIDEALCWEHIAKAADRFFSLPVLGAMDSHEIAEATHDLPDQIAEPPHLSAVCGAHEAGGRKGQVSRFRASRSFDLRTAHDEIALAACGLRG
jgi:hypothetical protein